MIHRTFVRTFGDRHLWLLVALIGLSTLRAEAQPVPNKPVPTGIHREILVHISWGHTSKVPRRISMRVHAADAKIVTITPRGIEADDVVSGDGIATSSGAGDVDAVDLKLRFPDRSVSLIDQPHVTWDRLLEQSDEDTVRRLRSDPGFRRDDRN